MQGAKIHQKSKFLIKVSPVTSAMDFSSILVGEAVPCGGHGQRSQNRENTIKLGGPGKVVQIDESLFRHKPKVATIKKRAYYFK